MKLGKVSFTCWTNFWTIYNWQRVEGNFNAFKCNLKELTTKSALSAWGQRSLVCTCPVAGYIDHVIHWCFSVFLCARFCQPFSFPPPPLPLGFVSFFSMDVFQCGGSWLGCAVAPVLGALFHFRGWLPIVEAPGYSGHPTSILVM